MNIEKFMSGVTWVCLLLLAVAITYVTWDCMKPRPDKVISPATISTEKVVTKTTKTKKPNGEVVIIEERVEDRQVVKPQPKTKYSIGAKVIYDPYNLRPEPKDYQIDVGKRLGQSDVWVEGGVRVKAKELTLGVRVEI
jgi:hypothetical protein